MKPAEHTTRGIFALTLASQRDRAWYLKLMVIGVAFALTIIHIVSVQAAPH